MKKILMAFALLAQVTLFAGTIAPENNTVWAVYDDNKLPVSSFYNFDPVIFYSQHHPILAPLLVKGKTLVAYVSLGDAENSDFFYKDLVSKKLIAGQNPYNTKRSVIDIRNSQWESMVLDQILPSILMEGFNGFCLRNLGAALNLELQQPEKYQGMTKAALRLLGAIKEQYGAYTIMVDMHGLLHIGDEVAPFADAFYYENLFTKKGNKMTIASAQNYLLNVKRLQELQAKKPNLKVYTLDFWPAKDQAMIRTIYAEQRRNGFIPYVTEDVSKIGIEPVAPVIVE